MMTQELVGGKMYPLTIKGLEEGMGELSKQAAHIETVVVPAALAGMARVAFSERAL